MTSLNNTKQKLIMCMSSRVLKHVEAVKYTGSAKLPLCLHLGQGPFCQQEKVFCPTKSKLAHMFLVDYLWCDVGVFVWFF